jgi:hypothetical protein
VESRLVGRRLYLVTRTHRYEESGDSSQWRQFFLVTGIDFSDPAAPLELGGLEIELDQGWGNAVTATSDTLLIAANHYVYDETEGEWWQHGWSHRSTVYLVDLKSPDGAPRLRASTQLAGRVSDKFKLRLHEGVLTTIAQAQGYRLETYTETVFLPPPGPPPTGTPPFPGSTPGEDTGNPDEETGDEADEGSVGEPVSVEIVRTRRVWHRATVLETFTLEGDTLSPAGSLQLAEDEFLRATRFHGDYAYIVTFLMEDPLFVVDLSDPAKPTVLGELVIPGWSNYLQVLDGGRLFSLGVEDRRVALALFDVSDPANMRELSRVHLGTEDAYSWSEGNYDEKALSVFPDEGLALVPFQAHVRVDGTHHDVKALQLVEIGDTALTQRGQLLSDDRVRRASLLSPDLLVSVSHGNLVTASLADRDRPTILADLPLAWTTDEVLLVGDYLLQVEHASPVGGPFRIDPALPEEDAIHYARPVLRVTHRDAPDTLLATFPLAPGNLRGLTLRDGKLHALYFDHHGRYRKEPRPDGGTFWHYETLLSRYRMESYDLSDPLAPASRGQALRDFEAASPSFSYASSRLQAAWLESGHLVWMPAAPRQESWWRFGFIDPIFGFGIGHRGDFDFGCWWFPMWSEDTAHLLVAEVESPAGPRFTAGMDLGRHVNEGQLAFSEAFLAAGQVVLTEAYHWYERIPLETPDTPYPRYRYENHVENRFLSVSVGPDGTLVRPFRAEIPGSLTGAIPLQEAGLLALTRERLPATAVIEDARERFQTRLHAHLFDGAQLLPIDHHTLPPDAAGSADTLAFAFAERVIYRAGPVREGGQDDGAAINRIQFGPQGRFSTLEDLALPRDAWPQLDIDAQHLIARTSESTRVWQLDGPHATFLAEFDPATQSSPWGWSWRGLGAPVVDPGASLWIPAGFFGVDRFTLPPLPETASATIWLTPFRADGWTELAPESLALSDLEAADAVGPMETLRWRFRAHDFAPVDAAAHDHGDYWYRSDWLGWYHQRGDNRWFYHPRHGWLWTVPGGTGAWLYDLRLGWTWTGASAYPYLWSHERGSWLFFLEGADPGAPRWFYNFDPAASGWFTVPKS